MAGRWMSTGWVVSRLAGKSWSSVIIWQAKQRWLKKVISANISCCCGDGSRLRESSSWGKKVWNWKETINYSEILAQAARSRPLDAPIQNSKRCGLNFWWNPERGMPAAKGMAHKFEVQNGWLAQRKCRPTAWTDYPSVFSILSCGIHQGKYLVTFNSLDNGQKEKFRVPDVAGSVAGVILLILQKMIF